MVVITIEFTQIDLNSLAPAAFASDEFSRTLQGVSSEEYRFMGQNARLILYWTAIDSLPNQILDALANDLHIDWYDPTATPDVKRALIKNSDLVHMQLGTIAAVERVINDYFGEGKVEVWHEYGAQPHRFRIYSEAVLGSAQAYRKFIDILEKVKRKSAHLDGIFILIPTDLRLNLGLGEALRRKTTITESGGQLT